jgi:hypothetical protein
VTHSTLYIGVFSRSVSRLVSTWKKEYEVEKRGRLAKTKHVKLGKVLFLLRLSPALKLFCPRQRQQSTIRNHFTMQLRSRGLLPTPPAAESLCACKRKRERNDTSSESPSRRKRARPLSPPCRNHRLYILFYYILTPFLI